MRWLKRLWAKIKRWWKRLWSSRPGTIQNFQLELEDMDIVGNWNLPTTRGAPSNRPLPIEEISHTLIEASLDAGATWTELSVVPATDPQTFRVTDAEIGRWDFRGIVVDQNGRTSTPLEGSVEVPDESPPGPITDLTITLE